MSYPQITEYQDAVQDPRNAFSDTELKAGRVAETPLGLPLALSGGFALTYRIETGQRAFAVRCFHREVPEAQKKYAAISNKLQSLSSAYFVHFQFQSQGIRVHGRSFPIVKMDWVEGETLGVYLDRISSNPRELNKLRRSFSELAAFLEQNTIAHGDIQNDNIIVQNGSLRLIDYDGMFVGGMPTGQGTEVGQRNFQHPARTTKDFGPHVDRFSFIVIDVSLEALIADGKLHRQYREGGLAIILKANDFADPSSSPIFQKLQTMPALRESARKLEAICAAPISAVPTLANFIAGRNIPAVVAPPPTTRPTPAPTYMGAFDVVDATSYAAVEKRLGDKIELVGKVVSVKHGVGKRGRGKDRPYVFINFGIWNKESVKITIWSEGLFNMTNVPTNVWVGRWISVTGLVEPPYVGSHYGRAYRNIGVTVVSENQIIQLNEQEAAFRLGRVTRRPTTAGAPTTTKTNTDVLKEITGRKSSSFGSGRTTSAPTKPVAPPMTTNQKILAGIKPPASSPPARSPYAPPYSSPQPPSSVPRIPVWLWWVIGIAAVYFLIFLFSAR